MDAVRLTRKPTIVTAVLSVAALVAYGAWRLTTTEAPDDFPDMADEYPAIVMNNLDGAPTALAEFSDQATVVNFWATWCAPCLREIPLLKSFHDQHDSIGVIGIAVDDAEAVAEYAEEMLFNYPVLIGQSEGYEAMAYFRNTAQVMPFTAFTAPGGAVLGVHFGELHAEELEYVAETFDSLAAGEIDLNQARTRLLH